MIPKLTPPRPAALIFFAASLAGSFALGRSSARSSEESPPPAEPKDVEAAVRSGEAEAEREELLGVILPRLSAELAPRFQGSLKSVNVRIGDRVAAGSVLAVLDQPAMENELRVTEAALKTAEVEEERTAIELSESEERLKRRKNLAAKDLVSTEELASAEFERQRAVAQLATRRAQKKERQTQVDRLRQETEDLTLRAPFDGIVAMRFVDPGANVSSATPIVRLISARERFVRFAVSEGVARRSKTGAAVEVRIGDGGPILRGIIDKVAPEIDAASRLVIVEADLLEPDASSEALSGATARVSIVEKN